MQQGTTDFTEGSIPRHLITFSVPMLLGNFLQAMYSTVDSFWVGRYLGPEALAAVSASGPVIHALIALVLGLTIAVTTIVAQHWGAKQEDQVRHIVTNSILLLTVVGIIVSVIGILARRPLLRIINVPPDVFDGASTYLGIYLSGLVAMFLYNAASSILRGLGDSRTPLRFLAYATFANIILDPIFIFGAGPIPRMEIAGVALATVISQAFSAILALTYLHRVSGLLTLKPGQWQIDFSLFSLIAKIGLPAGVQQTAVSLSALTVNSIVNKFGSTVMAGYGAGLRLDQFAFMPAMSGGLAVTSLVGQNLGAGREDRVRDSVRWSLILTGGITAALSLVVLAFPDRLIAIFTRDGRVIAVGAEYLRFAALSYVPYACMFALSGVLRGAGDTVSAMLMTLTSLWVVRVPLAATLSRLPQFGIKGVWMAIVAGPVAGSILNYAYYKTGRWKRRVVVRRHTPVTSQQSEPSETQDHPN
ncbi:MAG: MATE family efflux transporter [Firmicutes bacterium]|mgnify:CR=1 FL=1|jgi:putative MATE family efflux protein|nr:MATE family efflux transporter [Bacillota bacterium]